MMRSALQHKCTACAAARSQPFAAQHSDVIYHKRDGFLFGRDFPARYRGAMELALLAAARSFENVRCSNRKPGKRHER
jgi:hypothetical protein